MLPHFTFQDRLTAADHKHHKYHTLYWAKTCTYLSQ